MELVVMQRPEEKKVSEIRVSVQSLADHCKTTDDIASVWVRTSIVIIIIIIINIIKDIYIAQVRKGHKCAMSAEMAVWLRNCLCIYVSRST